MKTMKIGLFLFVLSVSGWMKAWAAAGGNNRGDMVDLVAPVFAPKDDNYRVRFTTTIPANTATLLLATHTYRNFSQPPGITFSTGTSTANLTAYSISTNSFTTWGGRAYAAFQVVTATGNLHVDFSNNVSTMTSPYYTQGQWVILDDPFTFQEPVYVMGETQATITGWFWTVKPGVKD